MQESTIGRPMEILLVEDNRLDIRVTMQALKSGQIVHRLTIVCDGEEALSFLKHEGPFVRAPHPDLILLDLFLPRRNGLDLLEDIRQDPNLKDIPVVVLTASDDLEDQDKCEQLRVDAYISKPVNLQKFLSVVKQLKRFWLQDVLLPTTD